MNKKRKKGSQEGRKEKKKLYSGREGCQVAFDDYTGCPHFLCVHLPSSLSPHKCAWESKWPSYTLPDQLSQLPEVSHQQEFRLNRHSPSSFRGYHPRTGSC